MKHTHLIGFAALTMITALPSGAFATPYAYANTISSHNIAAFQMSITNTAIQTFSGSSAASLGGSKRRAIADTVAKKRTTSKAQMYGSMPIYGEFNDDGSSIYGRSGGELGRPELNNLWLNWTHYGDDVKFNNFERLDSDYDVAMAGVSGGDFQMIGGIAHWGIFGGYVGGTQENSDIKLDEGGGFVGLYSGLQLGNYIVSMTVNAGILDTTAENLTESNNYSNMWTGAALDMRYNIALDATFTLQSQIYANHTWIRAGNLHTTTGNTIDSENFNMFTVAPGLRAIKHVANNWYGFMGARYTFNFATGGETYLNDVTLPELEIDDYSEYYIGIEKSIDRFSISGTIGRREGGRTGWIGGLNLKYLF